MKPCRRFATTLVMKDKKFSQHCLTIGFILTFVVKTLQTTKFGRMQVDAVSKFGHLSYSEVPNPIACTLPKDVMSSFFDLELQLSKTQTSILLYSLKRRHVLNCLRKTFVGSHLPNEKGAKFVINCF